MERLPADARLLDLGCGNGELWRSLRRGGYYGLYVGLDFSPELLQVAEFDHYSERAEEGGESGIPPTVISQPEGAIFLQTDLSTPDWEEAIQCPSFDVVLAFAVLHHLPGHALRLQVLQKVRRLLALGGRFYHSEWQFLNSPRLRARIQPWTSIGLSESHVDPGDHLLDWRRGGYGLRYVHHFSENELRILAEESGFRIIETFLSDGEGSKLGLYQMWELQD